MVKHNMQMHEIVGLMQIFLGAIWLGFGLVSAMFIANKVLIPGAVVYQLMDIVSIILFFGPGAVLIMLGIIELREVLPGKNRG